MFSDDIYVQRKPVIFKGAGDESIMFLLSIVRITRLSIWKRFGEMDGRIFVCHARWQTCVSARLQQREAWFSIKKFQVSYCDVRFDSMKFDRKTETYLS